VKKYRVLIPQVVQDQIHAQVLYIARDSVNNALAWETRLRAAFKELATLPTRNPVDATASDRIGERVRKMVFERTYLVFYRIRESNRAVDILNFRHGAHLPQAGEP
jgi:plasmid stabilization system protein ParE